jgi:hypothetical protein
MLPVHIPPGSRSLPLSWLSGRCPFHLTDHSPPRDGFMPFVSSSTSVRAPSRPHGRVIWSFSLGDQASSTFRVKAKTAGRPATDQPGWFGIAASRGLDGHRTRREGRVGTDFLQTRCMHSTETSTTCKVCIHASNAMAQSSSCSCAATVPDHSDVSVRQPAKNGTGSDGQSQS